jgi:large subunit ribosomal protein L28
MARVCDLTGRRTTTGNNRPFSLKATKRKFKINLQRKWLINPLTGERRKFRLSTKAIKSIAKNPTKYLRLLFSK